MRSKRPWTVLDDTLIAGLLFPGYLACLDPGAVPLMVSATRSQ